MSCGSEDNRVMSEFLKAVADAESVSDGRQQLPGTPAGTGSGRGALYSLSAPQPHWVPPGAARTSAAFGDYLEGNGGQAAIRPGSGAAEGIAAQRARELLATAMLHADEARAFLEANPQFLAGRELGEVLAEIGASLSPAMYAGHTVTCACEDCALKRRQVAGAKAATAGRRAREELAEGGFACLTGGPCNVPEDAPAVAHVASCLAVKGRALGEIAVSAPEPDGKSVSEMAALLGVSGPEIRVRLHADRNSLKRQLDAAYLARQRRRDRAEEAGREAGRRAAEAQAISPDLFGDAAPVLAALAEPLTLEDRDLPAYETVLPGHCRSCRLPGTWKDGLCWYCCTAQILAGRQAALAQSSGRPESPVAPPPPRRRRMDPHVAFALLMVACGFLLCLLSVVLPS